jgi:hypothetical protein
VVALSLAALLQAATEISDPADWRCADPLIAKNYSQPVASHQLALRIADECLRPYPAHQIASPADEIVNQLGQSTYRAQSATFVSDIEARILQARRKDSITLKR